MFITEEKEVNTMKKLFAIVTLLATLMAANIADAKFSDDYRAKYPKRVKVETKLEASGKRSTKTTYTLFKYHFNGSPYKLVLTDYGGSIKFCHLIYGTTTNSPVGFTTFSWGDGVSTYELRPFLVFTEHRSRGSYFHYVSVSLDRHDLSSMERSVTLNLYGGGAISTVLLDKSQKKWKEWEEALQAAERLMIEK